MAIEKMLLLNLVSSLDEEHAILQQLVLCENVHLNLEHSDLYDNNFMVHEYETMLSSSKHIHEVNYVEIENQYNDLERTVLQISSDLNITLKLDKEHIKEYVGAEAIRDLELINQTIEPSIEIINQKRAHMNELICFLEKIKYVRETIDFNEIAHMNYFDYEIGMLSRDNKLHIKKNYENISALVLKIGIIEDSREDIYIIFYLKEFKDETKRLLKSLNWHTLYVPEDALGNIHEVRKTVNEKIVVLKKEIGALEEKIIENKEETALLLNKIYTRIKLEQKITELKQQIIYGNNVFVLNAWIRAKDREKLEEIIANITDKYVVIFKTKDEIGKDAIPPTELRNNWFFKPFETIVKLYGLPAYNEIDPTPFLGITFCFMFGIMFGDIGQGLVYFLVGVLLYKKNETAGGVLTRLGLSSIAFGFIYGSIFGLEHIPILEKIAVVHGGPLNEDNIMPILLVGVIFGVFVLTISFMIGIINLFKKRDIEHGVFGKNGVAGYLFFMGLVMTFVTLGGVIPISVLFPVGVMVITFFMMIFKEPLTHLVQRKRPLIQGSKSSYYVESSFEGIETILSSLSNGISFIRIGAFALNHAGLFLAFIKMSEMTENQILKFFILLLGNLLILTLEGLVVFIQGLRLQYYEMFSKYFSGDGIAYHPVKIRE
ncbi:V-type ATP synthase subunit I [Cellulosilyticum sp. I15G10I2]|uniref:V-type ATP synthase subunit I n=1 Tax=Cellulosilyticum sp. I15G10I2 TaxID=1892843 RepID=UPI00085CA97A|nr:V-type ATPase 116kDa subunit family protein [Cellulosilyticum sp. I15G10I2]